MTTTVGSALAELTLPSMQRVEEILARVPAEYHIAARQYMASLADTEMGVQRAAVAQEIIDNILRKAAEKGWCDQALVVLDEALGAENRNGVDEAGAAVWVTSDGFYRRDGYSSVLRDKEGYVWAASGIYVHMDTGRTRDGRDREGYGLDGYNEAGFNRLGFGKDGYNEAGYDIMGFNKAGFNVAGYNVKGFNADGYNVEGFNEAGYNAAGYDKEGYDVNGIDSAGRSKYRFDASGRDSEGYDRDGRDIHGCDREGFDVYDRDMWGFDKLGRHYDGYTKAEVEAGVVKPYGYDRHGYDEDGYDRHGRDRANRTRAANIRDNRSPKRYGEHY